MSRRNVPKLAELPTLPHLQEQQMRSLVAECADRGRVVGEATNVADE